MAIIINSERRDDHIILSLKINMEEAKALKNIVGNVSLIPHESDFTEATVYERGKNGATKYFLIPKSLRKNTRLTKSIQCAKVDADDKVLWVYFMDKLEH